MHINKIGVWTIRIMLCGGAIAGGLMDKDAVTSGCITALILSFIFLDTED